jgi:ligand-binding SRPBCC domain-containing protein
VRASGSVKITQLVIPVEVVTVTELRAPPEAVWARVTSFEGINHELGPWLRMTAPRGTKLSAEAVPLGRHWFRSWILLFGLLPFDYDDLCVESIEPGRGFLERSTMLSARSWEHERTLDLQGNGGTHLTDRVAFVPRLPGTAHVHRAVVAVIFRHRHRRLRQFFDVAPPSP